MFGQMAAAPKLNVPLAFIDLLTERMAVILDLDAGQIHDALTPYGVAAGGGAGGESAAGDAAGGRGGAGAVAGDRAGGDGYRAGGCGTERGRAPPGSPRKMPSAPGMPAPAGQPCTAAG